MVLTGKTYDRAKFIALILLPALGALYFSLAQIWGLPAAEQVVGTITILDTFLGAVLRISSNTYAKEDPSQLMGTFEVLNTPDGKRWNLVLEEDPEKFETAEEVRFRLRR
jgi:DNA-directed RNA polymerase subunit E'/Rpb7